MSTSPTLISAPSVPPITLEAQVKTLAAARKTYDERKAQLDAARAQWDELNRHLIDSGRS